MPTEEEVYDKEVAPLMKKIIATCKKHKIPMLADFLLHGENEQEDLHCTTYLLDESFEPDQTMLNAAKCIMPRSAPVTFLNTLDKDGKIIQSTAIL